ncbi:putative aluminum-activated malate transporter [Helianthus annuus]|uniref:Aluminum-activated malate transporter n=1 Tax=Helianthus annuus TaxID=4232 RepID=A0A9K3IQ49_HELAN|nr:putative aluminum-activated malate transporter [Helianthus annuus]KAJ0572047.1 putative aluminum-activated malate transporter [Helianthus annuus]
MENAAEQPSLSAPTRVKFLAMAPLITYLNTLAMTFFTYLKMILSNMLKKKLTTIVDFAVTIKKTWVDDPRTSTHSLKAVLSVTLISMVYYIRPLYKGLGDAGICAIVTVIGVFDYTVGESLRKCLNNSWGTLLGCAIGVGAKSLGNLFGPTVKPVVVGSLVLFVGKLSSSQFVCFDYISITHDT